MQCPKCQDQPLTTTTFREVTLDRCQACSGVWFDERELPQVLRLSAAELRPIGGGTVDVDRDEKIGRCPRHDLALTRVHSAVNPKVVVETCLDCRGIWLDGGELELLSD